MQYFREKYQNVAFVVASDDRQWITQMFKNMSDVHLTPRYQTMKRGEYDMAILAQCNHSIIRFVKYFMITGKSLSEALIFASTNSQYDNRLFSELQVQYM